MQENHIKLFMLYRVEWLIGVALTLYFAQFFVIKYPALFND